MLTSHEPSLCMGYMQGMVLPHKIYLCDELYCNIEVQKTCAPTSKERHILDLICIKILTGCHLENCLFQSTYNDFSLNAFDYSMYKIFKQLLALPQCSPLLHRNADNIVLPLGIVYIKIFHDVL